MPDDQKPYQYMYMTITGEGDAHQIVKDYAISQAWEWNKGEIEQEHYLFEQMSIRIRHISESNELYLDEEIDRFFVASLHDLYQLPMQYERTLHLVTHGTGHQDYGFYLSPSNIQQLAQLQAHLTYHGYQQPNDGHDYPFSRQLPRQTTDKADWGGQYAYLHISSTHHTVAELAQILDVIPNNERSWNKGDLWHNKKYCVSGSQVPRRYPTTYMHVDSGLPKGLALNEHIAALMQLLAERYSRCMPLLLDYRVQFALVGTGYFSMPYQWHLAKEVIQQLAQFRCWIDMDLYAQT